MLEGIEGVAVPGVRRDVVAGGKQMTGIQADAYPRGRLEVRDDCREMLELVPESSSLTGRVLEENHRLVIGACVQRSLDRTRYQSETRLLAARGASTRMDDHTHQPENLGSIELVNERLERQRAERVGRCCQIDQVTGV